MIVFCPSFIVGSEKGGVFKGCLFVCGLNQIRSLTARGRKILEITRPFSMFVKGI